MKTSSVVFAVALFTATGAFSYSSAWEFDTNRIGNDIRRIILDYETPAECRSLCEGDDDCIAWTYVGAGIQEKKPVCWLKDAYGTPTRRFGTISGVKIQSDIRMSNEEVDINRVGQDYRSFLTSNDPTACSNQCAVESNCVAWTFVPFGIQDDEYAKCWLKDIIPNASYRLDLASGYKY